LLHEERRTDIAKLLAAYLQLSLIFNAPKWEGNVTYFNIYGLQYQQVEVDFSPAAFHCKMCMWSCNIHTWLHLPRNEGE
jgi:hypothetical protein